MANIKYKEDTALEVSFQSDAIITSSDCDAVIKKEMNEEACLERTPKQIKTEAASVSDAELDSETYFSPELITCKIETNNCNDETDETQVEQQPLWLQNNKDTYNGNNEELSQRKCKEEPSMDDICVLGFPVEALQGKSYKTVREDHIEFEESTISNTESPSASSKQRHSNHNGEDSTATSSLENNKYVQEGKVVYKCTSCDKTFPWMAWLRKHSLIHEKKKLYQCEVCEKSFTYKRNLNHHYLMHKGKQEYTCSICGKTFNQNSNLKRHKQIHEGKRIFKCEICGKTYGQDYHLKRHQLIHEGQKPHKCEICDKCFTYRETLKQHYLVHEENREYKCKICGKIFLQNRHLKRHILNHEGKGLYTCQFCGKSYAEKQSLKEHIYFHKGLKPYKCDMCDKSFTYKRSLRQHYLIHNK